MQVFGILEPIGEGFIVLRHPAVGTYCAICGSETEGKYDRELHASPVIRFCDICGANLKAGERCDAGLHS